MRTSSGPLVVVATGVATLTFTVVAVVATLATACGTGAASHPSAGGVVDPYQRGHHASAAPDASVAFTAPGALACPPTFAAASPTAGGARCDPQLSTGACSYPEGSCYCGVTRPCSGAEPDPAEIARIPPTWQCTATPPVTRADGCPGSAPSDGDRCTSDGKVCSWGSCCFTQLTCTRGAWVTTGGGCPP